MKKINTKNKSFDIFTMQCDKWAILHIARLLKKIFLTVHSKHIFFPK